MVEMRVGGVVVVLEGREDGMRLYMKGEKEGEVIVSPPKIGGFLKVLSGIEDEVRGRKGEFGYRLYKVENGYRLRIVRWGGEEQPEVLASAVFRGINLLRLIEALKREIAKVSLVIVENEDKKIIKSGGVLTLSDGNATEILEPREVREFALLIENKEFAELPYQHGKINLTEEEFRLGNIEISPEDEKIFKLLVGGLKVA